MSDALHLGPATSGSMPPVRPGSRKPVGRARDHMRLVAIQQAIEMEVIPRLVLEHGARRGPSCEPVPFDQQEASALADALLAPDPAPVVQHYARQVARPGAEAASLALLTAAARHLGVLWEKDLASFSAVTLATMYLQTVLRSLSEAAALPPPGTRHATAMLLQVPGEQHTLGLSMLVHGFRRDGWRVLTPKVESAAALAPLLAGVPVDLVGFSIAADMHLSRLAGCIRTARRASPNPDLIIMAGGAALLARPELGCHVGACATAASAEEATRTAVALLERRRGPAAAAAPSNRTMRDSVGQGNLAR